MFINSSRCRVCITVLFAIAAIIALGGFAGVLRYGQHRAPMPALPAQSLGGYGAVDHHMVFLK